MNRCGKKRVQRILAASFFRMAGPATAGRPEDTDGGMAEWLKAHA